MKNVLVLIVGLLVGAAGFWLFSRHHAEEKHEEEAAHETAAGIKLDKKQQEAAGIETTQPQPTRLPVEVKAYGRALDSAPLVALALDVQSARAALDASSKEFERVKILHAQNQNASARAFEVAEAADRRDRILLNVAESKLQAALGPALATRENLPELIERLAKMQWTLARLDTPPGNLEQAPARARIAASTDESASMDVEILGPAPAADATIQGRGFLVLLKTNSVPPNLAIVGWLQTADHAHEGFLIPAKAVLQEGAETIVFIQTGEESFKKQEIEVERMTERGAFVTEGLAATNRVVTTGAHQILSVSKAEPAD